MNKTTIELNRTQGHWSGWGRMFEQYDNPDSTFILDQLMEWSKANPKCKIYRHVLRRCEENRSPEPSIVKTMAIDKCQVHTCDLVDYMDIYWQ